MKKTTLAIKPAFEKLFSQAQKLLYTFLLIPCCLLLFAVTTSAQVIINPHPIAGFQFSSKDILNFDVVFSHTESIKVQYEASLQDANGRLVVQYLSGTHVLKPGANSYTPSNYNIAETRYVNRAIGEIEKTTRFLPSGDYTFCINLKCVDSREVCERAIQIELDYSACSDAHAEPITPLLLSFPEDESEIEDKRPNFTWIPPMPIGNDPNLTYTFNLVKMLNDQTAEDAIRRNRSLYKQKGLRNISLMFPNQLDDLEEGEHYAWQVSAHIGDQHIATSDVWEFEVEAPQTDTTYFTAKSKIGLETYQTRFDQPFGVVFNERYSGPANQEGNWTIRVKNLSNETWETVDYLSDLKKHIGKSNLILHPQQIASIIENKTYLFEFTNNKNDKYFVRIRFTPSKDTKSH